MGNLIARKKKIMMMQRSRSRLPQEYQEVEYLFGSTNPPYLLTDITAFNITKIKVTSMPTAYDGFLISTSYGTTYKGINYYMDSIDNYWYYYGPKVKLTQGAYNQVSTAVFDIGFENGIAKSVIATIDGVPTAEFYFTEIPTDALICIGGANGRYNFYGRIYESVFYQNTTIVGDFVPCYRKLDNKPGVYNTATNMFITGSGTGEYLLGPDIN